MLGILEAAVKTVYVELLDEGTPTYRPTKGLFAANADSICILLPTEDYDPTDETWAFLPGFLVRCEVRTLRDRDVCVAIASVRMTE